MKILILSCGTGEGHLQCGYGHTFPFFQKEKGGKCIAVSFGVMPGLFPEIHPVFF